MITTIILTFSIRSIEEEIRDKKDEVIVRLENKSLTFEEFQKKIIEIEDDYYFLIDLIFWRDVSFYTAILVAMLSLYTFYSEQIRKKEIEDSKKELNQKGFQFAYAKLPKEKKVEKIEKIKKLQ